jgi:EF-P beta-lysylation protein EpmB
MSILTANRGDVAARSQQAGCDWRQAMCNAIRDPAELCRRLELDPDPGLIDRTRSVPGQFGLFVPLEFLQRMRPGRLDDPLLRQVLPLALEDQPAGEFVLDPVDDEAAKVQPGLLHKYHGRALLVVTGQCAVHCRYCFRQNYPYEEVRRGLEDFRPALQQLERDKSISEILLSGGDPLTLGDSRLRELIGELAAIDHIKRLRIHTRLPIVIPQRVTDELIECLSSTRLVSYVVIHANHAQELDEAVLSAATKLIDGGSVVLNQSVLLRGVNDSVEALVQLSEKLIEHRVLPYYLHQLDRVRGTAHFEVPEAEGHRLVSEIRKQLPGYAVPRYVREIPGESSKTPLA